MMRTNEELLQKVLNNDPELKDVSLQPNEFPGLEFIKNLVKALNTNTTVTSLNMDNNYLDDECVVELRHLTCPTLAELSLQNNKFTSKGVIEIAKIPHLRVINVSYNAVDDAGAIALSRIESLENLNISFNSIGNTGVTALLGNRSLHKLEMEGNNYDESGLKSVFDNNTLFVINARNNKISREYSQKVKNYVATHYPK